MSSEDRNGEIIMDADSGDEVHEKEDTSDELLAVGNDPQQERDGAADFEETSATQRTEEPFASYGHGTIKNCLCNSRRQTSFKRFGALEMRCILCGEVINGSHTNKFAGTPPPPLQGPLNGVVAQSYAVSLPALPSISLEDNSSEQEEGSRSSHRSASLVTGRSQKIPEQNVCEDSAQNPSPGMSVRVFLFERTHRERNELWYIMYIIPETDCKVYETILKSYIDEARAHDATSQQGYTTRQIPFAVDNARSKDFFTVYVHEQINVSFEIQNYRWQENFVTQDAGRKYVFQVPVIHCQSKNRVVPGAKSQFRVVCVGRPGELCQEQGKITLTLDSAMQYTLFFSITLWVPDG